tara:strand:- start:1486 stop:2316 length:831 start_codon:yes stop_codon:yes gene_type:complete
MWFDIIKIQQGTFSTLVPKTLPKRRVNTPCRDRLNGIMDEIKNTATKYEYRFMTSVKDSPFLELIEVFNKDGPIVDQLVEYQLPEPIHVDFTIPMEIQTIAEHAKFDDTPEDVCCEFLKYLEESKKEVLTALQDRGVDEMINPKQYKDWEFDGRVKIEDTDLDKTFISVEFRCRPIRILMPVITGEGDEQIKIEFYLGYGRSGINWTEDTHKIANNIYSEEQFYNMWMSRTTGRFNINRPSSKNEEYSNYRVVIESWLTKKEVHRWFVGLDPMWWL